MSSHLQLAGLKQADDCEYNNIALCNHGASNSIDRVKHQVERVL